MSTGTSSLDFLSGQQIFTIHPHTHGQKAPICSTIVFSALEVCYENALYKFTFDIDIDIVCMSVCLCLSGKVTRLI